MLQIDDLLRRFSLVVIAGLLATGNACTRTAPIRPPAKYNALFPCSHFQRIAHCPSFRKIRIPRRNLQ
jgi:hypothetical protein